MRTGSLVFASACWALGGATLQPLSIPSCTTTTIQPAPTEAYCGVYGNVKNLALLFKFKLDRRLRRASIQQQQFQCQVTCLGSGYGCGSYSYEPESFFCTMYFKSLTSQGFLEYNDTSGPVYYDTACYGSNCPIPTSTITQNPLPTQVCSITNHYPRPSGVECIESSVYLKKPDVISSNVSYDRCVAACLGRKSCNSLVVNDNNNTCVLFGETLIQQGLTKMSTNDNLYYSDKKCFAKGCVECYPSAPTKTFAFPSNTPTCNRKTAIEYVSNPSFENSPSGAPWQLRGGAVLVTNNPVNASQGRNFVMFSYSGDQPANQSIRQSVQNLTPGMQYQFRFSLRKAVYYGFCYIIATIDNSTIYKQAIEQRGPYPRTNPGYVTTYGDSTFVPTTSNAELSIISNCIDNSYPNQFFIDSVELIIAAPVCTFHLQVSSSNPKLDGLYATLFNSYKFSLSPNRTAAALFGIDGYNNFIGFNSTYSGPNVYNYLNPTHGEYFEGPFFETRVLSDGFGTITCQIGSGGSLQCVNKPKNQKTFVFCGTCPRDEEGIYLVAEGNPLFAHCLDFSFYAV